MSTYIIEWDLSHMRLNYEPVYKSGFPHSSSILMLNTLITLLILQVVSV